MGFRGLLVGGEAIGVGANSVLGLKSFGASCWEWCVWVDGCCCCWVWRGVVFGGVLVGDALGHWCCWKGMWATGESFFVEERKELNDGRDVVMAMVECATWEGV